MIYWSLMTVMAAICGGCAVFRRGLVRNVAIAVGLSWIVSATIPVDLSQPLWAILFVDAVLLAGLAYWVLVNARPWLVCAAACQSLVVFTHIAFASNPRLEQWGYLTAYYVWSVAVLGCLLAGAVTDRPSRLPPSQDPLNIP